MFLGFGVPVSGVWATPGNQVRFVQRAETLGYRTVWTFQRLLVAAASALALGLALAAVNRRGVPAVLREP